MAKRRRVTAPSKQELEKIEAEFRGETARPPSLSASGIAPIAQVSGETAARGQTGTAAERADRARDSADAERWREAEGAGRMMVDLPLDRIDADAMVRDRMVLDQSEMEELRRSILAHGLRLPIEVFARDDGTYGLISGYRRLKVAREIHHDLGFAERDTIRALVRDPEEIGGAVVAMIEENEIRAGLSHYERGRIAVISAQQGLFETVEAAVNTLFESASKAKRSKIRSFALIHEELGDLLEFADRMKERDGLRLANALRAGGERALRGALEHSAESAETEWRMIEPVIAELESGDPAEARKGRGGRPRRARQPARVTGEERLSNGVVLRQGIDENGDFTIHLRGGPINADLMELVMQKLKYLLDQP